MVTAQSAKLHKYKQITTWTYLGATIEKIVRRLCHLDKIAIRNDFLIKRQSPSQYQDPRCTVTLEVFHPLFALLPPCLDRCKSRSTIGFFLIGILVAAPNSLVEQQCVKLFTWLPSRGLCAHPVSQNVPAQLDLPSRDACLQSAPFLAKGLFGNLLCERSPSCEDKRSEIDFCNKTTPLGRRKMSKTPCCANRIDKPTSSISLFGAPCESWV